MEDLVEEVRRAIASALPLAEVWVEDPNRDQTHLQATVVSDCFEGLLPLARQRLVMKALERLFSTSLHALKLQTFTRGEWNLNER